MSAPVDKPLPPPPVSDAIIGDASLLQRDVAAFSVAIVLSADGWFCLDIFSQASLREVVKNRASARVLWPLNVSLMALPSETAAAAYTASVQCVVRHTEPSSSWRSGIETVVMLPYSIPIVASQLLRGEGVVHRPPAVSDDVLIPQLLGKHPKLMGFAQLRGCKAVLSLSGFVHLSGVGEASF